MQNVLTEFEGKLFSEFKPKLASVMVDHLSPVRKTMLELLADEETLLLYLKKGAEAANTIACANIKEIRQALNMI